MHSTATALLEATNEWYLNVDQGNINLIVFLDLAKAFDTVSHDILLQKLELYGISGLALNWIKLYLSNRKQLCVIEGSTSQPRTVTCGVLQGSILGQLLFLIYINDLPACFKFSTARKFADDTSIATSCRTITCLHSEVDHDLNNIQNWLLANQLSLNVLKTEYLYCAPDFNLANIGASNTDTVKIGGEPIFRVHSQKSLGVMLDQR